MSYIICRTASETKRTCRPAGARTAGSSQQFQPKRQRLCGSNSSAAITFLPASADNNLSPSIFLYRANLSFPPANNHHSGASRPTLPRRHIFPYRPSRFSISQYTAAAGRFHLPAANTLPALRILFFSSSLSFFLLSFFSSFFTSAESF